MNTEALLIAAGQNIKRLLTYGNRGPKRKAQVVVLHRLALDPYEFFQRVAQLLNHSYLQ